MALPQQVQDQLAAAEAMLGQAPTDQEPVTAPEAGQPQEQQAVEPQIENVAPEPTRVEPPAGTDWEHKYKVLQGMFNKQASQAKELQRAAAELQARLEQASQRQPDQNQVHSSLVVEASDVDNFGQDVMDMVHRVAAQHVSQAVSVVEHIAQNLSARVQHLEKGVEGVTAASSATAEQMFFERLTNDVPNWEAVNQEQAFVEWLNDVDPMLGDSRMSALTAAREALDSARVSYIFKTYLREAEQAAVKAHNPLAKQLTPRAAASAAPVATAKATVSERDIVAFYTDVAKGLYAGRDAEVARIENEFNLALAEGRVTP